MLPWSCVLFPVDEGGFFFALATAPAHVEDKLQDAWLEFAEEDAAKGVKSTGEPDIRQEQALTTAGSVSLLEEEEAAKIFAPKDSSEGAEEDSKEAIKEYSAPVSSPPPETAEGTSGQTAAEPSAHSGEGGSPNTPTSGVTISEWEVVSDSSDKDKADDSHAAKEAGVEEREEDKEGAPDQRAGNSSDSKRKQMRTTAASHLQFDPSRKAKQLGKVGMEAMLRGINKVSEMAEEMGEESCNVAAWQNAFNPYVKTANFASAYFTLLPDVFLVFSFKVYALRLCRVALVS